MREEEERRAARSTRSSHFVALYLLCSLQLLQGGRAIRMLKQPSCASAAHYLYAVSYLRMLSSTSVLLSSEPILFIFVRQNKTSLVTFPFFTSLGAPVAILHRYSTFPRTFGCSALAGHSPE